MINKVVLEDATKNRKKLFCIWIEYQKAFDSVSHKWLFEALKLAKVPDIFIEAVIELSKNWIMSLSLHSKKGTMETDLIKYLKGILQGDSLSMIIVILTLNPLSFLLKKLSGYKLQNGTELTHLFL